MEDVAGNRATIKPISKSVVHRICAGQVILDLASAVKELVENSLDAGATSIEIALKEYGLDSFQVIDNGSGISPENFKVLAMKHHTSKLAAFPDLQSLATFGFRGEALSSICAIGDMTVETRTVNEVVATHLTYDHKGLLTAERKCARQIGTTVTVRKLFSNLPVRSQEFRRNIRKEYGKLVSLLNAYALISKGVRLVCSNTTGKNARSVVLKTQGSGSLRDNIITVFGTSMFSCLEPVRVSVADGCTVEGFVSKAGYGSGRSIGDRQFFFVNGRPVEFPKVGKLVNELYRGANSKQYPIAVMNFSVPTQSCDVNVTPDKSKIFVSNEMLILQSLREALEQIYSSNQATYSVNRVDELNDDMAEYDLYIQSETSRMSSKKSVLDVDVFDDKTVGVINVKEYQDATRDSSGHTIMQSGTSGSVGVGFDIGDHDRMTKNSTVGQAEQSIGSVSEADDQSPGNSRSSPFQKAEGVSSCAAIQMSLDKFVTANKRKREVSEIPLSEIPLLRSCPMGSRIRENCSLNCDVVTGSPEKFDKVGNHNKENESSPPQPCDGQFSEPEKSVLHPCGAEKPTETRGADDGVCNPMLSINKKHSRMNEENMVLEKSHEGSPVVYHERSEKTAEGNSRCWQSNDSQEPPVAFSSPTVGFTMHFSFKNFIARRKHRSSRLQQIIHESQAVDVTGGYGAASLEVSQAMNEEGKAKALVEASNELERLFNKEDFRKMKVIGQFNLGFIVGKLNSDLFIVDQHAADEKYNYETLAQTTVLNQQPLLRPLKMHLSPEEEIIIPMHMTIFRKNGFLLEEDANAAPGHRFLLKAVPFSKNILFGVSDVQELIAILSDNHGECSSIGSYRSDSSDSVCPPKVREMLASRACRSSVMIGDSLGRNEMQKIVENLASLKSPWNCPHGRPTMRHLVDLKSIYRTQEEEAINL